MVGNIKNGGRLDIRLRLALAAVLVVMVVGIGIYSKNYPEPLLRPVQGEGGAVGEPTWDDIWLVSRMVAAEAQGEPFQGQVAVASVIFNRVRSPQFPGTVSGVLYEPWAYEPVMNGSFWSVDVTDEHLRATELALNGYDPTYGSLYFWNPATSSSPWIWTRRIIVSIGNHVFGL